MKFFISLAVLFLLSPLFADSLFISKINNITKEIQWHRTRVAIPNTNRAALNGSYGLELNNHLRPLASRSVFLPFLRDSWFRFYIKIDSIGTDTTKCMLDDMPKDSLLYNFLVLLSTREEAVRENNISLVMSTFAFEHNSRSFRLVSSPFSLDSCPKTAPMLICGKPNCTETHLVFGEQDSVFIAFYLNGVLASTYRLFYPYEKEFLNLKILSDFSNNGSLNWKIFLDDFAFSDKRIFPLPPRPIDCSAYTESGTVDLSCSLPENNFHGDY